MMAKVFDHTSHKFCKGFRMLTLGWSDGNSFLPVSFNLLSSSKQKNVLCPSKTLDKRTIGHKHRCRAMKSTTDALIEMLRAAKNIPAKYVLFDSWFTLPKTVVRVKKEKRDVIGMIRITEKVHYLFDGQWQNVKEIYKKITPSSDPKSTILGSVNVKLREEKLSEEDTFIDAKIVFVKDRRSDNWLAILCTDIKLEDDEVVRIYGKRWDIEVFFKICKFYLSLAKEFQGRSYDMQVASTTITFLRYAMLSIETRNSNDNRTIGDLFYYLKEELANIKLSKSLMLLIDALREVLNSLPVISQKLVHEIMDQFINAIPDYMKRKLLFCA